ncbi:MAG: hypothetical protein H6719_11985 [Sandaracinaceae bacterium]|nr:hypothetical protein [Sandaracinaceae bacterium]
MRAPLQLALAALLLAACEGPAPFCGGFEDPLAYELSLSKLSLNLDEFVPVAGELCVEQPTGCECVSTDEDGLIRVDAPRNTEILGEVHATGYVSTILVHRSDEVDRFTAMRVLDRATLTILGGTIGERIERTRGQLAMRISAAEGADVTGSVVTLRNLDTGEVVPSVYTQGRIPDPDATSSDDSGVVLGVNLVEGRYEAESAALGTCGVIDAGWPRYDASGRLRALEFVVRADRVTLIDALRCFGPGA